MLPSAGLWRAVVHRSRAEWPVVVAAGLLLTAAITLLAAGALYADTVALGGLRRAILEAPPADRAVVVRTYVEPADLPTTAAAVEAEIAGAFRSVPADVARIASAGSFAASGIDAGEVRDLTVVAAYGQVEAHARLVGGGWPTPGADPVEGAVSEGAAAALGVAIGDRLELIGRVGRRTDVTIAIAGIFRPDAADPYWLGDPLELDGVVQGDPFTTHGPIVVPEADLAGRLSGDELEVSWRAVPSATGLRPDRVDDLRRDLAALPARLEAAAAAVASDREPTMTTGLAAILEIVSRTILVSRSGVLLLTVQFAVLAGYAVLLVAGMLVDRRRAEVALLRSRGATSAHLALMALLEALLVALPAAVLAPVLAFAIVRALGAVGPLADAGLVADVGVGPGVIAVTIVAGLASAIALTLPTLASTTNVAGVRAAIGRQGATTLPQRIGIDLALVVLAGVGLWQLRLYGAPLTRDVRGTLGIDPLLVAAPGIGLLAGAIVAIRIVPRVAEVGERLLGGRRGFVLPLGARQLARRPLRYTRAALLLMLAAALGTFASAHAATWTRSQADQARFRSVADVRVVSPDYSALPGWGAGSAYRGVPGVLEATPLTRHGLEVGRAAPDAEIVGLDPAAVARIASLPADEPGLRDLLASLPAARPQPNVVPIPVDARELVLSLDSAFGPIEGSIALPPGTPGVRVAVTIRDGDGRLQRLDGTPARLDGTDEAVVPLVADVGGVPVRVAAPAGLQGIDLRIQAPAYTVLAGALSVRGIAARSTPGDDATRTPVALDAGATGWSWTRLQGTESGPVAPVAGDPGTIAIGDGESPAVVGNPAEPGPTFRLWVAAPASSIPAIASRSFLEKAGAAVGDTVEARAQGVPITLRIVGAVTTFPPLDPERPSLLVDGTTLEFVRFAAIGHGFDADEWWLDIDPARAPDVAAALAREPFAGAEVLERGAVTRALSSDPVPLGVIGALGLGAIAALAFAAIGFLVSATVAASERQSEFALLQALGLSARQLSTWLTIENAFLLTLGLTAGAALGLVLAWVVLPVATLTASGAAAVPRPVIVLPWEVILPVGVGTTVLLIAAVAIVTRQASGDRLAGVLRARDE